MSPLVSIIIPAYNAETFIGSTINSAINQTYTNIELIIVDDGSTDGTLALLKSLNDDRIKIITQKNRGASFAKQAGLNIAKGDFVQYLDADDLLSLDKIEEQLKLLKDFPNHVAICATVHFENGTDPYTAPIILEWFSAESSDPQDFLIKLYGAKYIGPTYGGMIQPNAFLTPISIIKKAGSWNASISPCPDEDGEYFCRIILASEGVIYANKPINYYRKFANKKSLSGNRSYQASKNLLTSTQLIASHLLATTTDENAKIGLSRLFWENAFTFYPVFKDLSALATKEALKLCPKLKHNPYANGLPFYLSKALGWKTVKYLQYLKQKL